MSKLSLLLAVKKITQEEAKALRLKMTPAHKINGKGEFEVVATTDSVDRDGEVLAIDGWEFANYMLNPVVIWSHDLYSLPLGAVTDLRVENNEVIVKGVFADTDEGQEVRKLYEAGILRTVSVGYIPKERQGNTITRMELFEVSFVTVPANPDAMSTRQKKEIKRVEQLVTKKADDDTEEVKEDEKEGSKSDETKESEEQHDEKVTEKDEHKEEEKKEGDEETKEDNKTNETGTDKGENKSASAIYPKSTDAVKPHTKAVEVEVKAGRVLSSKNISAIQSVIEKIATYMAGMQECSDMLQAIIDDASSDKAVSDEKENLKKLQTVDKLIESMIVSTKNGLKFTNKCT